MSLDRAFLFINLMLVLVSIAAHEVASGKFIFLTGTVVLCWLLWRRKGDRPVLRLSQTAATLICLAAFLIMLYRAMLGPSLRGMRMLDIRVSMVGQFLIVFQWVSLLRKKRSQEYAWIFFVSVVHMGTAGLLMPGPEYAIFFIAYSLVAVCTLTIHHLWRKVGDSGGRIEIRIGSRFFLAAVPVTLGLMLPVAALFVLLPRRSRGISLAPRLVRMAMQPTTGFSQTVRLGDIGRIQSNPARVMDLRVFDPETGERLKTPGLLLRGLALDTYDRGRRRWFWRANRRRGGWMRISFRGGGDVSRIYSASFPGFEDPGYRRIRCDITLDAMQTSYLFAPFAPEEVVIPGGRILFAHTWHHGLQYDRRSQARLSYTVTSRIFTPRPQEAPSRSAELRADARAAYLSLSRGLSPKIAELAGRIVPPDRYPDDYAKALRIQDFLSDPERFTYTMRMDPTPGVEPVEDFLFNRRRGHCEYFASAMVLLLRSAGIPARLVNGFKVTEWNPISGYYVVRQSDAHSWVEAYLQHGGWRTFDPSVQRDAAMPRPMFVRRLWRDVSHLGLTLWVRHVLTFDAERQAKIYESAGKALGTFRGLWRRITRLVRAVLPGAEGSPLRLLSWRLGDRARRALLSVAVIGMMVALAFATPWIYALIRPKRSTKTALKFYLRMERLLVRRGFRRNEWQTPWEFHNQLSSRGWPAQKAVAAITRTFCAARYGGRVPSQTEFQRISHALDTIRRTQHPRRGKG